MRIEAAWMVATGLTAGVAQAGPYHELTTPRAVDVEIRVGGTETPLYNAVDGSGRYYFEARAGARYDIVLTNRTGQRLGADVDVDGLNVVSGERDRPGAAGRMYILDPWESTTIRGWRTSLENVRRFTFVDEKRSYAARSGKANEKMGWVEIAVYRERRAYVRGPLYPYGRIPESPEVPDTDAEVRSHGERAAPARARASGPDTASSDSAGEMKSGSSVRPESYPGTGWGERTGDLAHVVSFDYHPYPIQNIALRYEYASGLRALGIVPDTWYGRDRLHERDRTRRGFAQPPGLH